MGRQLIKPDENQMSPVKQGRNRVVVTMARKSIDTRLAALEKRTPAGTRWLVATEMADGRFECGGQTYTEAELDRLWAGQHGIIIDGPEVT